MRSAPVRTALFLTAALAIACGEDTPSDGTGGRGGSGTGGSSAGSGGSSGTGGSSGGSGGSGATGGSSGGKGGSTGGSGAPMDANAAVPEAGSMEIRPMPALPPRRPGNTVFHSTNVSMWEIHDMAVYTQYKANFDEIISILERGYFGIAPRLGTGHKLPIRVIIEAGGCCGGLAGGGDVGYADGDFNGRRR